MASSSGSGSPAATTCLRTSSGSGSTRIPPASSRTASTLTGSPPRSLRCPAPSGVLRCSPGGHPVGDDAVRDRDRRREEDAHVFAYLLAAEPAGLGEFGVGEPDGGVAGQPRREPHH